MIAADFRTLVPVAAGELQQIAIERRAKVEEFQRKHRVGLLTLLFTDVVDSVKLKQALGEREAVTAIQQHYAAIREILNRFGQGQEIETAGDAFFIVFTNPSDAVKFSLFAQARLRALAAETGHPIFDRIGIHIGEKPDLGENFGPLATNTLQRTQISAKRVVSRSCTETPFQRP